jgi:hypothetical protein
LLLQQSSVTTDQNGNIVVCLLHENPHMEANTGEAHAALPPVNLASSSVCELFISRISWIQLFCVGVKYFFFYIF